MVQYIDKSALVAEIKKGIKEIDEIGTYLSPKGVLTNLLCRLDTLEVKEVDLDEIKIGETQIYIEDDGGEPPYDSKQWLDLECLEYEIPRDKFKDGDNVEIILRKIRKGK